MMREKVEKGIPLLGLAVAVAGLYVWLIGEANPYSAGFMGGIGIFLISQICWVFFFLRHACINWHVLVGVLFSAALLFISRVMPAIPAGLKLGFGTLFGVLSIFSITSVALACGEHKLSKFWCWGLAFILLTNAMVGFGEVMGVPYVAKTIVPLYVTGLAMVLVAICRGYSRCSSDRGELGKLKKSLLYMLVGSVVALALFGAAIWFFPDGSYNPLMRMLSVLGRVSHSRGPYPLSHFLFTIALAVSALAVAQFYPMLANFVSGRHKRVALCWGGVFNAAGLLGIALVPEDVNGFFHNTGCLSAVAGAAVVLILLTFETKAGWIPAVARWGWFAWCVLLITVFEGFLLAHRFKLLPFAPYVPTVQKMLIMTFVLWMGYLVLVLRQCSGDLEPQRTQKKAQKHCSCFKL